MADESRLLLMSCSARKRDKPAPAVQLYDGSAYRVLHKRNLDRIPVLILSAKYGLLSPLEVIEPYDRKMDAARATELCEAKQLRRAASIVKAGDGWPYRHVFCYGGSLYRQVFEAYEKAGVFGKARVEYSEGRIGEQLSQLAGFLKGRAHGRQANFLDRRARPA